MIRTPPPDSLFAKNGAEGQTKQVRNKSPTPVKRLYAGCLLVLELISVFHHYSSAGFVSQLHVRLSCTTGRASGRILVGNRRTPTRQGKSALILPSGLFVKSFQWLFHLVQLLKMFSASALWPLCLLQHFPIFFTPHNPHYPPFVSPRLSLCLSQLPVSLIPNPVETGQAEWASFDQALISGALTVSAHPDPTEPRSPGGELQTGVQPLTLLERKGKGRLQSSCLNCQLQTLAAAFLFYFGQHLLFDLTPFN